MASVGTIARRTFLVGSVAIAGGVAFGYYMVRKPHENPLLDSLSEGEAAFNPWVKVSSEGVTLIAPHTDLGQGVASMQAALIAEELDMEFGQFTVSFGAPAAAYYNTALAEEMAPFRSTDKSLQAEAMRTAFGAVVKLMGAQGTGGSSSVPDSFEKLRLAGAVARETLKKAAAKKTGVAVEDMKTAQGAVHLPDGSRIDYTDLAAVAADIKPVTRVTLRDPSAWRLLGKPMQRLDIAPKSTGTLPYGIDLEFDGMLHATVKTNPRQGGSLNGYDARRALEMRGVKTVLPVTNGVAVIADNTWRAFQAANAISFDWGAAPYPAEQAEHWAEVERSFTEERLDNEWRNDGDMNAALDAADSLVTAEYRAPYVAHQPLEPIGAVIKVADDGVDIWVGHQIPRIAQDKVAAITGHAAEQVRLHNQYIGGSFGHRLEFENVTLAAEIGNQMRGETIKLTFSREEDFARDYPRQLAMAQATGVVAAGRVEAFDISVAGTSVSDSQTARAGLSRPGPDGQLAAGAWNLPYAIPHYRMRAYKTPGLAPVSSWRSVGASTQGFFADCFLDELIHAAGADPMEERLRLCDNDVARKVLEAVADMSNWGADPGPDRGRGVAFVESFGVPVAEVVEVAATEAGVRIEKVFVAADVGLVVDPVNFDNHVKGAVVWGLGHAMNCEITYSDGKAQQTNFHQHEGMRLYQCPEIYVRGLENAEQIRGIGEPPTPPAAPALANAIFAATGQRIREMPFNKHIRFV